MHVLLSSEVGRRELLLGNEGVVRGALEAGVGLVTGYPGTPASEIGDTFAELHEARGIQFEYSVNEKVALELAFGASLTGVRTLISMKHLGLTYAGDPVSTMPYIGVVGGMVIVSAADPGCLTSPNEQDQRHFGRMLGMPTLDPATPDEARRMTAFAFELSEKCELPVLLRITTRVCHTRAAVRFEALGEPRKAGVFNKNPKRFLPTPANARNLREELEKRLDKACAMMTASPFNVAPPAKPGQRRALVAAGAPRNVVQAVLSRIGASLPVLELGALHPLPHELIVPFLKQYDDVLVVEELTPYLEDSLLAIAHHWAVGTRIHGKRDGQMPWPFELEVDEVERRVRHFLGEEISHVKPAAAAVPVPPRGPVLCAGCLHRNAFFAATAVFGDKATYVNDIGCYTLGANAPHNAGDVLLAMGSSVPLASGISRSTGERVVAFLGDSTFFHSGIPGLVNAVEHRDNVVVVILDNHVTAMTGFQPNPTSPGASQVGRIPAVVRAVGVEDLTVVDAADVDATVRAMEHAKKATGVSVVIAEGPCAQWSLRHNGKSTAPVPHVDDSRCHTCGMSEAGLYCELPPSLRVQKRMAVQQGPEVEVPRTSPCSLECPLGICIPAYVGAIAAGEPERALQAVELRAALPSVCSHICHRPCEDVCVHAERGGEPIAVNALKRYLTDRARSVQPERSPGLASSVQPERSRGPTSSVQPERSRGPTGIASPHLAPVGAPASTSLTPPSTSLGPNGGLNGKIAIVGAGPAGLAAARELAKRGYAPTLLDAHERPGGMLEYAVPDYRLPRDVLRADIDAVLARGVEFLGNRRLGKDFTLDELRSKYAAVLLTLGAQRGARPDLPGAALPGVEDALGFLAQPPSCRGDEVLVLGGGDVAIDVARTALRNGAAHVTMAFPEGEHDMLAARDTVLAAKSEGVRLRPGHLASSLESGANAHVATARLATVNGFRRTPQGFAFDSTVPADALTVTRVVFATGQRSDLAGVSVPGLAGPAGWLTADVYGRTSTPWLFAAGDVVTGPDTVTVAMAAGVRAAWAIDAFLAKGREVAPCAAPLPSTRKVERRHHASRPSVVLTEQQARDEAARCLLCGMCANCNTCVELLGCPAIGREGDRPEIIAELCVSCGACVTTCPNHAITSEPV